MKTIGFIGAGKVGISFGSYLIKKGFNVTGYYDIDDNQMTYAKKLTDTVAYRSLKSIAENNDILFITTSDNYIEDVCQQLAEESLIKLNHVIVHMSGAASSHILKSARILGAYTYSLHPLQSFATIDESIKALPNTFFSLEGEYTDDHSIESIMKTLGNEYFKITSEQKSKYHLSACVVSNYLVTLMNYAMDMMESIGVDRFKAFRAMLPLINGTIDNIENLGTKDALTGPIARGDFKTIQKHLESLEPTEAQFYKFMGLATLKNASLSDNQLQSIKKLLK